MVAMGLTRMLASHVISRLAGAESPAALWLCVVGLLGVFAVGYPGYFVFDAIWPELLLLAGCCRKKRALLARRHSSSRCILWARSSSRSTWCAARSMGFWRKYRSDRDKFNSDCWKRR